LIEAAALARNRLVAADVNCAVRYFAIRALFELAADYVGPLTAPVGEIE
jgi:hypothetical protein